MLLSCFPYIIVFFINMYGLSIYTCLSDFWNLVSSKEEVDASDSFCIGSVDFERFFEEDGKIYGYQGLKVNFDVLRVIIPTCTRSFK